MATTYYADIDHGQGGDTTLTADTLADAMITACEWAREGDWPEDGCSITVRVWRTDEDGDEIESDEATVQIESAEAQHLADGETVHEEIDEFRTDRLVRVDDDYYLVHANGGERGAHSTGGNHFPDTLSETEALSLRQARAWLLGCGLDAADVARLTKAVR